MPNYHIIMSSNISLIVDEQNDGFLSEFTETSMERPRDGLNGDCVVHYGGQYRDCEMHVKLKNGKKEGEATIMKDGKVFLRMEYKNDEMTGSVERLNGNGQIDLKGKVENGVESGIFQEYKGEEMIWRGYYRNGKRYSDLEKSRRKLRYYEERSVATGELLSIAKYDDEMKDKDGHCMEYENGEWIGEWVYSNGKKGRCIRTYRNGVVTLYDDKGNKTYEGKLSRYEVKDGFYGHEPVDEMKWYCKEVDSNGQVVSIGEYDPLRIKKNGKCYELKNGTVMRVCLYEMDRLIRVMMEFNGSTMVEYDENGKRVYEGEFAGEMSCGFFRNGYGKEMNGNGTVTYNGNWVYGYRRNDYLKRMEDIHLNSYSTEFETAEGSFNEWKETVLVLSLFPRLKRIRVGKNCFGGVRILEIDGLNNLESIEIGESSFKRPTDDDKKRYDGYLRIKDCPKLKSIHFMDSSFKEYYSPKLDNLPALETFEMDACCFYYAPLFSLKSERG